MQSSRRSLIALIPVGDGAALIKRRPDVRQAERRLAAATAEIGVATAELYPTIRLVGFLRRRRRSRAPSSPRISARHGVSAPRSAGTSRTRPAARARVRQAKASQAAALASFDSVVLNALKETEQALAAYGAALDNRQSLMRRAG